MSDAPDPALTAARMPLNVPHEVVAVRRAGADGAARALRCRLLEMGVLAGTEVTLIRRAPLGDPLELRLRGYALSLRREEAEAIEVRARSDA